MYTYLTGKLQCKALHNRIKTLRELMKLRGLIIFIVLLLAATALAAKTLLVPPVPENFNAGISAKDEAHEPHKGFGFVEMWSFLAKSNDGTVANCQFGVSNAGITNNFPAYNVTIFLPSGEQVNIYSEFKSKELNASQDRFLMEFPNVSLKGRHPTYYLKLDDPKIKLDLKFQATFPGVKLAKDGKVRFGKDFNGFYREIIMAPSADVSGTMTIKGETTPFNGWGYAEHASANTFPPSFVKRWYSVRFHSQDATIIHSGFVPNDDYTEDYFGITTVAVGDEIKYISTSGRLKLLETKLDPVSSYVVPIRGVVVIDEPGCSLRLPINFGNFIERIETLSKINIVARKIIGLLYARPYIYRYPPIKTAVKVDMGNGEENYFGEVIPQVVFFK